jgi:hypothetical protein
MSRQDVDDGEEENARRVVECHAVGGAGAAVVTRHHEALEAELSHHVHLVLRHAPE